VCVGGWVLNLGRKEGREGLFARLTIPVPAGFLWLTPIILATWEAEIGRTEDQASLGK
jgi:hypothetical protein